ncbi:MAG: hypothetical protein K6T86_01380 [Pirellulales bacterium]|nr:hypothetical protein [Pirellulales bacterium]
MRSKTAESEPIVDPMLMEPQMAAYRAMLVGILAAVAGCSKVQTPKAVPGPERVPAAHLPNAYRLHPKVISGGQPDGEAGFRELAALGIKTVISVDGAQPDIETAKAYGMRYVHLPHGYDGITEERARELAKAVRELPGPIYIHCHHGRHRSPTAAAVACVGAGLLPADAALGVLETAGTNKGYRGLYHAAQNARRFDDALLDALQAEFREQVPLPPLAEAMVELDETYEHLQRIRGAGWKAPASHPDLDPAHEALILQEHFAELLRLDEVQQRPADFVEMCASSRDAAGELHAVLAAGKEGGTERASSLLDQIHELCGRCHQQYRDVPLHERGSQRRD